MCASTVAVSSAMIVTGVIGPGYGMGARSVAPTIAGGGRP
jgi:hypothetical protein